jgi:hypothetical protein
MTSTTHHTAPPLTLRLATPDDAETLRLVAEVDSAPRPPAEPVLVAELGERMVAALSLSDGSVVADPFVPTADVIATMRDWSEARLTRRERSKRFRPRLSLAAIRAKRPREVLPFG